MHKQAKQAGWIGLSFRVPPDVRRQVERLAARLTLRRGRRVTMTEVLAEAIRLLAEREGVSG